MKGIRFVGRSLDAIREFPGPAKRAAGYQLERVQRGLDPNDWKPMKSVGPGVREIRIRYEGQYRILYVAGLGERIYVLHAFAKKLGKTDRRDIEIAKRAFRMVLQGHIDG